jgi:membrane protease YdiL (CAAX protease family)
VLLAGPLILAVYGVYVGVLWLQALGFPGSPETHPLAVLKGHLTPPEVVVLLLAVLVAAPALEELVARGVILRWCTQRYLGSHLAMLLSLGAALLLRGPGIKEAIQQPDYLGLLRELLPAFFVLVMGWLYGIVLAYSASPVGPAIFSSSLLFAIVHAFAWPSPVPLFVLALGLGWLAQRTQSLVGPILIHSVFNGVGCLVFFLS